MMGFRDSRPELPLTRHYGQSLIRGGRHKSTPRSENMSARDSIDRLFEAVIERQESTFDNIKGANERVHRFARSVLEGARQGAHDWTKVAQDWTQRPTDIVGLYEAASAAAAHGQARGGEPEGEAPAGSALAALAAAAFPHSPLSRQRAV